MQKMDNKSIGKQLNKLRRDKRFLWFGILFFVLIAFWILLSLFATTKTSSISPELKDLAKSFIPRLESKVFDEILLKRSFSEEELSNFSIYVLDKKNTEGGSKLIDITVENLELTEEQFAEEDQLILEDQPLEEEQREEAVPTPTLTPISTATPTPMLTPAVDMGSSNIDSILEAIEGANAPQN
jgi:hypothetical protein